MNSRIPVPWPTLHAGTRLVVGAFTQAQVADYGDARASERDAFWMAKMAEFSDVALNAVSHVGKANYSEREREAKQSIRDALATLTNPRAGETA